MDRRGFLTTSVAVVAGGVAGWNARPGTADLRWLRPPGAVSEVDFLSRCIRCHHCVARCPVDALVPARGATPHAMGTPAITARLQPCNLCAGHETMLCIEACPTEALHHGTNRREVAIGVARIDRDSCLPFQGVMCRACWRACPFAGDAIRYDALGRPRVNGESCVGCGLCEHACLTTPSSIVIEPFGEKRPVMVEERGKEAASLQRGSGVQEGTAVRGGTES